MARYERELYAPHANTSSYELYFESATANAVVFVNGVQAVSHRGVGLPFSCRLGG